jgi:hypothetical protein
VAISGGNAIVSRSLLGIGFVLFIYLRAPGGLVEHHLEESSADDIVNAQHGWYEATSRAALFPCLEGARG